MKMFPENCRWLAVCILAMGMQAHAKLNVVTTITDFAVVAEAVGGDAVKVTSLASGSEDPHYIDARPSFIRTLNRADLLIEGGVELEIGWLPPLVNNARNRDILPGGKGRLNASRGLRLMGIPTGPVDRSQGDVHALGNPHYMMDPVNAGIVARNIAAAMKRLQAGDADLFDRNLKAFLARLEEKEKEWKGRLAPFKGTKVVTYHQNFDYFAARFGLVIVDNIEPKPGIDPSPTDVQQLMVTMKEQGVKLVIIEPIRSRRTPEKLARSSGADVVVLPFMADADRKTSTYVDWIDHCISLLENSLKQ